MRWNRFITFILVLSLLCQNIAWAYGWDKLAKDSACDDPELLAAASALEEMLAEARRKGHVVVPPHLDARGAVRDAVASGEIPRKLGEQILRVLEVQGMDGLRRWYEENRGRLTDATRLVFLKLLVDRRPVDNELLDVPYVGHDMAVKDVVNPHDKPLIGVYGGAGADVSNFLLSTNASVGYFVDSCYGKEHKGTAKDVVAYKIHKYRRGYASEVHIWLVFFDALIEELRSIGVSSDDLERIELMREDYNRGSGNITIEFMWAYPGQEPRKRTIHFVRGDIREPSSYPPLLEGALADGIDFYYQRAGSGIDTKYVWFLDKIAGCIRPGGFLVTENTLSKIDPFSYIVNAGMRKVGLTEEMEYWADLIRPDSGYGWDVKICKKIKDASGSITPPDSRLPAFVFFGLPQGLVNLLGFLACQLWIEFGGWWRYRKEIIEYVKLRFNILLPQTGFINDDGVLGGIVPFQSRLKGLRQLLWIILNRTYQLSFFRGQSEKRIPNRRNRTVARTKPVFTKPLSILPSTPLMTAARINPWNRVKEVLLIASNLFGVQNIFLILSRIISSIVSYVNLKPKLQFDKSRRRFVRNAGILVLGGTVLSQLGCDISCIWRKQVFIEPKRELTSVEKELIEELKRLALDIKDSESRGYAIKFVNVFIRNGQLLTSSEEIGKLGMQNQFGRYYNLEDKVIINHTAYRFSVFSPLSVQAGMVHEGKHIEDNEKHNGLNKKSAEIEKAWEYLKKNSINKTIYSAGDFLVNPDGTWIKFPDRNFYIYQLVLLDVYCLMNSEISAYITEYNFYRTRLGDLREYLRDFKPNSEMERIVTGLIYLAQMGRFSLLDQKNFEEARNSGFLPPWLTWDMLKDYIFKRELSLFFESLFNDAINPDGTINESKAKRNYLSRVFGNVGVKEWDLKFGMILFIENKRGTIEYSLDGGYRILDPDRFLDWLDTGVFVDKDGTRIDLMGLDLNISQHGSMMPKEMIPIAIGMAEFSGGGREQNIQQVPDGFIMQGIHAWMEFERRVSRIRENDITARYRKRIISLSERVNIQIQAGKIRVYGFNFIVKATDDFVLGRNYLEDKELFIAEDVIAELENRGPPTLVDEYLLHEILCPVLGHYQSIIVQQRLFPQHYPNKGKGLLGLVLRDIIDRKVSEREKAVLNNRRIYLAGRKEFHLPYELVGRVIVETDEEKEWVMLVDKDDLGNWLKISKRGEEYFISIPGLEERLVLDRRSIGLVHNDFMAEFVDRVIQSGYNPRNRAKAIVGYLVKEGVRKDGYGEVDMGSVRVVLGEFYDENRDTISIYRDRGQVSRYVAIVDNRDPGNYIVLERRKESIYLVGKNRIVKLPSKNKLIYLTRISEFREFDLRIPRPMKSEVVSGSGSAALGHTTFTFYTAKPMLVERRHGATQRGMEWTRDKITFKNPNNGEIIAEIQRVGIDRFTFTVDDKSVILVGNHLYLNRIIWGFPDMAGDSLKEYFTKPRYHRRDMPSYRLFADGVIIREGYPYTDIPLDAEDRYNLYTGLCEDAPAVTVLSGREKDILRLRLGSDSTPGLSLEEIGKRLEVTRARIKQIEARAIRRWKGGQGNIAIATPGMYTLEQHRKMNERIRSVVSGLTGVRVSGFAGLRVQDVRPEVWDSLDDETRQALEGVTVFLLPPEDSGYPYYLRVEGKEYQVAHAGSWGGKGRYIYMTRQAFMELPAELVGRILRREARLAGERYLGRDTGGYDDEVKEILIRILLYQHKRKLEHKSLAKIREVMEKGVRYLNEEMGGGRTLEDRVIWTGVVCEESSSAQSLVRAKDLKMYVLVSVGKKVFKEMDWIYSNKRFVDLPLMTIKDAVTNMLLKDSSKVLSGYLERILGRKVNLQEEIEWLWIDKWQEGIEAGVFRVTVHLKDGKEVVFGIISAKNPEGGSVIVENDRRNLAMVRRLYQDFNRGHGDVLPQEVPEVYEGDYVDNIYMFQVDWLDDVYEVHPTLNHRDELVFSGMERGVDAKSWDVDTSKEIRERSIMIAATIFELTDGGLAMISYSGGDIVADVNEKGAVGPIYLITIPHFLNRDESLAEISGDVGIFRSIASLIRGYNLEEADLDSRYLFFILYFINYQSDVFRVDEIGRSSRRASPYYQFPEPEIVFSGIAKALIRMYGEEIGSRRAIRIFEKFSERGQEYEELVSGYLDSLKRRCGLKVFSLGGNSLLTGPGTKGLDPLKPDDFERIKAIQRANVQMTLRQLLPQIKDGGIITHGNGPEVGILLHKKLGRPAGQSGDEAYLAEVVEETQHWIGDDIRDVLIELGIPSERIEVVITHVAVNPDDPAFFNPTKPIGPGPKEGPDNRIRVASPRPIKIVQLGEIRRALAKGKIVVCVGGGGIPVNIHDFTKDMPAVIDKDFATALLVKELHETGPPVKRVVISTAEPHAYLNYGKPNQTPIHRTTVSQIRQYIEEGHFAPGKMLPKVQAAMEIIESGAADEVVITSPEFIKRIGEENVGTFIVKDVEVRSENDYPAGGEGEADYSELLFYGDEVVIEANNYNEIVGLSRQYADGVIERDVFIRELGKRITGDSLFKDFIVESLTSGLGQIRESPDKEILIQLLFEGIFGNRDNKGDIIIRRAKNLPRNSSRYYVGGVVIVVFNSGFIDAIRTGLNRSKAGWLFCERLFHELYHKNVRSDSEEKRVTLNCDLILYERIGQKVITEGDLQRIRYSLQSARYFRYLQALLEKRPKGPLDGYTIFRYADSYDSIGGLQTYLQVLNRVLLERSNTTIIQMYITYDEDNSNVTEERIGRGRLIKVPILIREKDREAIGLESWVYNILKDFFDRLGIKTFLRDFLYRPWVGILLRRVFLIREFYNRRFIDLGIDEVKRKAEEIFGRYKVDLAMFHTPVTGYSFGIADMVKRKDMPVLIQHHGENNFFDSYIGRRVASLADGVSGVDAIDVPEDIRSRFVDLSDGIDTEFFKPDLARPLDPGFSEPVILLPTRVEPDKGHLDLVRITKILRDRYGIRVKIVFAGPEGLNGFIDNIKRLAKKYGLLEDIIFTGALSQEELRDYYAVSSVVALPSKTEGLPRVLLEAQAMGKPVVAYNVGGIPDAMCSSWSGSLIRRDDLDGFAIQLASLLKAREAIGLLGEQARMFVENRFNLKALAERHEKFYMSVLGSTNSAVATAGMYTNEQHRKINERIRSVVSGLTGVRVNGFAGVRVQDVRPEVWGSLDEDTKKALEDVMLFLLPPEDSKYPYYLRVEGTEYQVAHAGTNQGQGRHIYMIRQAFMELPVELVARILRREARLIGKRGIADYDEEVEAILLDIELAGLQWNDTNRARILLVLVKKHNANLTLIRQELEARYGAGVDTEILREWIFKDTTIASVANRLRKLSDRFHSSWDVIWALQERTRRGQENTINALRKGPDKDWPLYFAVKHFGVELPVFIDRYPTRHLALEGLEERRRKGLVNDWNALKKNKEDPYLYDAAVRFGVFVPYESKTRVIQDVRIGFAKKEFYLAPELAGKVYIERAVNEVRLVDMKDPSNWLSFTLRGGKVFIGEEELSLEKGREQHIEANPLVIEFVYEVLKRFYGKGKKEALLTYLKKDGIKEALDNRRLVMHRLWISLPRLYEERPGVVTAYRERDRFIRFYALVQTDDPDNYVIFVYKGGDVFIIEDGDDIKLEKSGRSVYPLKADQFKAFDLRITRPTKEIIRAGTSAASLGQAIIGFSSSNVFQVERRRGTIYRREEWARDKIILKDVDTGKKVTEIERVGYDEYRIEGLEDSSRNPIVVVTNYINLSTLIWDFPEFSSDRLKRYFRRTDETSFGGSERIVKYRYNPTRNVIVRIGYRRPHSTRLSIKEGLDEAISHLYERLDERYRRLVSKDLLISIVSSGRLPDEWPRLGGFVNAKNAGIVANIGKAVEDAGKGIELTDEARALIIEAISVEFFEKYKGLALPEARRILEIGDELRGDALDISA